MKRTNCAPICPINCPLLMLVGAWNTDADVHIRALYNLMNAGRLGGQFNLKHGHEHPAHADGRLV